MRCFSLPSEPFTRRTSCCATFLLVLAGCESVSRRLLPAVVIQVTAEVECPTDGGACDEPPVGLSAPFCGYDVSSLDAGTVVVHVGQNPADLEGLLDIETELVRGDGGREALVARRVLLFRRASVFPALGSETALYEVDSTGTFFPFSTDGGVAAQVDGGSATFDYSVAWVDGGSSQVHETHQVLSVASRDVDIHNHGGDPFYGCCAHLGWGTPSAIAAALVVLRLRRRERRG